VDAAIREDPIERDNVKNSIGLMYDPNRRLVWVAGQNSHIHVARLDFAKGLDTLK
jgi:hypothetical protein